MADQSERLSIFVPREESGLRECSQPAFEETTGTYTSYSQSRMGLSCNLGGQSYMLFQVDRY